MLTEKLQEEIKKHLPQMVANEMLEFINDAKKKDDEISQLKQRLKTIEAVNKDYLNENLDWRAKSEGLEKKTKELASLEKHLTTWSDDLKDAQKVIQLQICNVKLEEANKRADSIYALTEIVFRNNTVKQTVHSFTPTNVKKERQEYVNGQYVNQVVETTEDRESTVTTTKEVE